ncbi:PR-1-like protein [Linnemannia elongata AG-77]|uniref:PR-1-like protein n=1 Tax=Linnemannia elongata AG-77 TaxID=1314771 RepID=A0A197K7Z7_9FUNG|nr:PR-1-like protein [Linnemannia elongata AG-77]
MVKFTSILVATVAFFAASASAQISTAPREAAADQLERRDVGPGSIVKRDVLSAAEQKIILDTHNKYRARHGAPALTWNAQAAAFGNNWIQACQFKHSGGKYGENLAAGYKDFKTGIDAWYNEVSKYNYNRPGFSMATGHFTQVVWKNTKSVGCAKKFCPGSNWTIYICNYDPPGNYQGQYEKNVLPAK